MKRPAAFVVAAAVPVILAAVPQQPRRPDPAPPPPVEVVDTTADTPADPDITYDQMITLLRQWQTEHANRRADQ